MLFNGHQSRLWGRMIQRIEDFRNGKLQYSELVHELEGMLDACEFKDNNLIEQWYQYWIPLEILYATMGNNVTIDDANKYLTDMEGYLIKHFRK